MRIRRSKPQPRKSSNPSRKPGRAPADPIVDPTPELRARVKFELGRVTSETGQAIGFAYRREPLFETMGKGGKLRPDELTALRYYRGAFDRSERSPVRSCLNISGGGASSSGAQALFSQTPSMLDAKLKVRHCESGMGQTRDTMRAVVLDDKSFSEIAMDRFGSHTRPAPRKGEAVQIRPKSGRHREIIRREFLAGLKILTDEINRMEARGVGEEVWVDVMGDGSAKIRRTLACPLGKYRCWGDNAEIDRVMADLRTEYGAALHFPTAGAAIHALSTVAGQRLRRLEPSELED